ncbi:MAG: 5-oxoprolinase subunit PxpB [Bacillota bacterium]|nr:5-oxoprolinase subunit PxpB [Bacillota bacterium]
MALTYKAAGDTTIIIEFANEISEKVNTQVRSMYLAIEKSLIAGIEEVVPTYRSLMICYNPLLVKASTLMQQLKEIELHLEEIDIPKPKIIEIPTLYGGDYGPDLDFVAEHNNLTSAEVINLHSKGKYLIYMLGFTPGFPYLGGLDQKIATPRLEKPRLSIPAGSVGIAGAQTGIYPIESPGGWRLIGRTPLRLFDPNREPHFLLQLGDYLQFKPVDESQYGLIKAQVDNNIFEVKTSLL